MSRTQAMLALLLLAATLVACGRAGPIRPPGPPDQVTYPRTYPSR
jgi:predicted small lipoprotein YifL